MCEPTHPRVEGGRRILPEAKDLNHLHLFQQSGLLCRLFLPCQLVRNRCTQIHFQFSLF